MNSLVTLRPASLLPLGARIRYQTCERETSAPAASSIRLKVGTAPGAGESDVVVPTAVSDVRRFAQTVSNHSPTRRRPWRAH